MNFSNRCLILVSRFIEDHVPLCDEFGVNLSKTEVLKQPYLTINLLLSKLVEKVEWHSSYKHSTGVRLIASESQAHPQASLGFSFVICQMGIITVHSTDILRIIGDNP